MLLWHLLLTLFLHFSGGTTPKIASSLGRLGPPPNNCLLSPPESTVQMAFSRLCRVQTHRPIAIGAGAIGHRGARAPTFDLSWARGAQITDMKR